MVTPQQHRAAWRTQDERTASKPSCLSFSHYKSASSNPFLNKVDTHLQNILLDIGFSPLAWQTITDGKSLKNPNEFWVDKMRLIQLMTAEFQICNKNLGWLSLAHSEQAGAISADQHGSQKHHQAIETCLNKKLLCDVSRQQHWALAFAMNDAKGCYNHISHSFAVLTLMSFGLACLLAVVLFVTLQRISTSFGRSEAVYGDEPVPLSGVGQGNGIGPSLWALISSTKILDAMRHAGHSVTLRSSLSGSPLCLVGLGFVDDTDPVTSAPSVSCSAESLILSFQRSLDQWSSCLGATGSELAPEKSFCYLIDYVWTGTSWDYRCLPDIPGDITLTDKHGTCFPLCRFEVSHAKKTLGVFISMDGNESAEFD